MRTDVSCYYYYYYYDTYILDIFNCVLPRTIYRTLFSPVIHRYTVILCPTPNNK